MISRAASALIIRPCGRSAARSHSPGDPARCDSGAASRAVLSWAVLSWAALSWAALSWAAATRSCSRARTSSGVYARRRRSARAATTPVAATPASPATPSSLHSEPHGIRCRDMGPKFAA